MQIISRDWIKSKRNRLCFEPLHNKLSRFSFLLTLLISVLDNAYEPTIQLIFKVWSFILILVSLVILIFLCLDDSTHLCCLESWTLRIVSDQCVACDALAHLDEWSVLSICESTHNQCFESFFNLIAWEVASRSSFNRIRIKGYW